MPDEWRSALVIALMTIEDCDDTVHDVGSRIQYGVGRIHIHIQLFDRGVHIIPLTCSVLSIPQFSAMHRGYYLKGLPHSGPFKACSYCRTQNQLHCTNSNKRKAAARETGTQTQLCFREN